MSSNSDEFVELLGSYKGLESRKVPIQGKQLAI
jgi:hypothetical protein